MDNIEQIFFEEIIKEAATGYIDCGFFVPICFSTKELVNGQIREITNAKSFDNTMMPSLVIQDRQQLTNDIASYLEVAKNFYQLDPRVNDSNNKSKYIIVSLLANTLVTDFTDLSKLFKRHTNFILDDSLIDFVEGKNIGYSDMLKSNIIVSLDKQSVVEETPYGINIRLEDDLGNTIYDFPTIRYGISDNKAYIYAIQGEKHAITNKKIERILRKVGEGFDEKGSEKDPISNPENLYSINPWSLVALSIAIPLIKNYSSVDEFIAPYFLINRWNAVEISYQILSEKYKNQMSSLKVKSFIERKREQVESHDTVQRNITDKFIRSFRRLDHHFDNITIESFQLDIDSSLHFKVDGECKCNNTLLSHVYNLSNNYIKESKQFGSKVN